MTFFDRVEGSGGEPLWPSVAAMWQQVAHLLETVDHEVFERTGVFEVGRWQVPYG